MSSKQIILRSLIASSLIAALASAQPAGPYREVLSNRSIVTLATAGFSEDFILETIASSHTHFDVTVEGLAGLAKQGINERIIRAMMTAPAAPEPGSARGVSGPASAAVPPMDPDARRVTVVMKPRPTPLAIASRTPYYESRSYLWGLFRKRVGVGVAAPRTQDVILPHLGAFYERVVLPSALYASGAR
jgi:hypothetical protein